MAGHPSQARFSAVQSVPKQRQSKVLYVAKAKKQRLNEKNRLKPLAPVIAALSELLSRVQGSGSGVFFILAVLSLFTRDDIFHCIILA
jgi:hypothetical protein